MTRTRRMMSVAVGVALLAGGGLATAQARGAAGVAPTVSGASAELARMLQFAREEERLARDLYKVLADTYGGAVPFSRITLSEQRHFDAVGVLLDRYDVADPSAGKPAGTYADATLQANYTAWLEQGKFSLDTAYDVGVALEEADIVDLRSSIKTVTEADVRLVLTRLLNASEHHLNAYQQAADGTTGGRPGQAMRSGMMQSANAGSGVGAQRGPMGDGSAGNRAPGMGAGQPSGECPLKASGAS